jgi:hypothetical protein
MVQSCPEASPMKWHQAHTTWFFETFVLHPFLPEYKPFREEFRWLFNSYYNSIGQAPPEKHLRASFSRPSLGEVLAFRSHVDEAMERLFAGQISDDAVRRIMLGLSHEQQHQIRCGGPNGLDDTRLRLRAKSNAISLLPPFQDP